MVIGPLEDLQSTIYGQGLLDGQRQLLVRLHLENQATKGLLIYLAEWEALKKEIENTGAKPMPPDWFTNKDKGE